MLPGGEGGIKETSGMNSVNAGSAICLLLPTNCLNVFDHFVGLALKGLRSGKTYSFSHWGLLINLLFKRFNNATKSVYRRKVSTSQPAPLKTANFKTVCLSVCLSTNLWYSIVSCIRVATKLDSDWFFFSFVLYFGPTKNTGFVHISYKRLYNLLNNLIITAGQCLRYHYFSLSYHHGVQYQTMLMSCLWFVTFVVRF